MKKIFKELISIICLALGMSVFSFLFKIRFNDIDITMLRFSVTYWREILMCLVILIISCFGFVKTTDIS